MPCDAALSEDNETPEAPLMRGLLTCASGANASMLASGILLCGFAGRATSSAEEELAISPEETVPAAWDVSAPAPIKHVAATTASVVDFKA
ncbi:hypothetical protein [Microbaculum sp. FT89]|uniref:hypothetical protein n=1 Tax=Microbaculum sp. FT89 TaxID=3447298 RepID=UPI003F52BDE1